jgi:hypothetical protein
MAEWIVGGVDIVVEDDDCSALKGDVSQSSVVGPAIETAMIAVSCSSAGVCAMMS